MNKDFVTSLVCAIIFIGACCFLVNEFVDFDKLSNPSSMLEIFQNNDEKAEKKESKMTEVSMSTDEKNIYDEMHKMINTKIIAKDGKVWGEIEITEEKCDELIEYINGKGFSDEDKLLEMLENWKNEDFSNGVEEHNYLWSTLGGTVGKAIGLREE